MNYRADNLLHQWAEFTHRRAEGLGYSHNPALGFAAKGPLPFNGFGSRLPRGVTLPGIRAYNRVEAALSDLGNKHRVTASLEYGVLRPNGEPLRRCYRFR